MPVGSAGRRIFSLGLGLASSFVSCVLAARGPVLLELDVGPVLLSCTPSSFLLWSAVGGDVLVVGTSAPISIVQWLATALNKERAVNGA